MALACSSGVKMRFLVFIFFKDVSHPWKRSSFGAKLFTKDVDVLRLIGTGIPFVAATQPINSLSFVFDGVNFRASDLAYSAFSLVLVAIVSIICLCTLSSSHGFIGFWIALSIYMSLRTLAGFWRIGTGTGPWKFLRD